MRLFPALALLFLVSSAEAVGKPEDNSPAQVEIILYQRGYNFKYLFNLSQKYDENRDRYYAKLRVADRTGDYTEWLQYFIGGLSNQMMQIEQEAERIAEQARKTAPDSLIPR